MSEATVNKPHIRWGIRRDMPEIMAIENATYRQPWTEDQFLKYLCRREVTMLVAVLNEQVIGYCVYLLGKRKLVVYSLTVAEWHRRDGIGKAFIDKVKGKLSSFRCPTCEIVTTEHNVDAQLFLRAQGFLCTNTQKNQGDDDSYIFRWTMPEFYEEKDDTAVYRTGPRRSRKSDGS